MVQQVLVNGREAKATAPNFTQWEIALDGVTDRELNLTAHAVDVSGKVEPRPHRLLVRQPAGNGHASTQIEMLPNMDPSSPEDQAGEKTSVADRGRGSIQDSDQQKADDRRTDPAALQGIWQMLSQQRAGRATGRPKNMKWVIQGDTISLMVRAQDDY